MIWIALTLGAAFFAAIEDAVAKATLRVSSPWVVAWAPFVFAAPILALLASGAKHHPPDGVFLAAVAVCLPLEVVAILLYAHAIQRSPLSLTIPFLSLTPVFTMPASYLLIGEVPGPAGAAGVVLIAVGAYVLNIQARHTGWLGPIRAIAREPGSRMMIAVALIYSVTSALGKIAVLHSGPIFYGAVSSASLAVLVGMVAMRRQRNAWGELRDNARPFLLLGLLYVAMATCHFKAVEIAPVAYMIALKRTSILFSVLLGWIFFHEAEFRDRLLGAALMVAGAVLITAS
jgi:drug/metabolite transporter (DMT)-like permease